MSVIVRDGPYIKMYIKGADSIIKERLAEDQTLNLDDELTKFSNIGLRTLLIGMRLISEEEYREFNKKAQSLPNDVTRDN
jgi:magnesium-transporting ATPase (P-type)